MKLTLLLLMVCQGFGQVGAPESISDGWHWCHVHSQVVYCLPVIGGVPVTPSLELEDRMPTTQFGQRTYEPLIVGCGYFGPYQITTDNPCGLSGAETHTYPNPEEPFDVPAIQVETDAHQCLHSWEGCPVTHLDGTPATAEEYFGGDQHDFHLYRATCADKSRFLLTDESGTRHCIHLGGK